MTIGPITYREIAAYQGLTFASLTAWEVRLIRRIDTAVRALLNRPKNAGVDAKDGKSVKAILRGLAAEKAHLKPKGGDHERSGEPGPSDPVGGSGDSRPEA